MNAPLTQQQIARADAYSRALAATSLTTEQRRVLATMTMAQVFEVLGEILEPSIACPFSFPNDELFDDALMPISKAYRAAYDHVAAVVEGVEA